VNRANVRCGDLSLNQVDEQGCRLIFSLDF
jgi:hypothetical protein